MLSEYYACKRNTHCHTHSLHYSCIECAMSTELGKVCGKESYSTESVLSEEEGLCRGQLPTLYSLPCSCTWLASGCVARQQLKQLIISSYQPRQDRGTMPDQHNHFHDITHTNSSLAPAHSPTHIHHCAVKILELLQEVSHTHQTPPIPFTLSTTENPPPELHSLISKM